MTAAQKKLLVLNLASIATMLSRPAEDESDSFVPTLLGEDDRRRVVPVERATPLELARSMGLSRTRPFAAAVVLEVCP